MCEQGGDALIQRQEGALHVPCAVSEVPHLQVLPPDVQLDEVTRRQHQLEDEEQTLQHLTGGGGFHQLQ